MAEDYSHTSPKSYELPQDRNESKLHFQEAQPPRKLKKPRPFRDNVREFMAETSLHGFKYWTDDRSWIERLWWIVMTLSSIVVCAIFIRKVWNKWDETPVIVSFAETSNSVWHIPFPAITICSETKPRQRVFNFTKAHIERWSNPPKISAEDLKTYHDMLLLCNNDASDGPDFAGVSSIETLQRLAPTREELFMACLWDNLTCDQMFFHTLTKDGYCFTFNMLSAEEMFRTENLHKEYYHVAGHNRSAWTLQQGYPHEATINTYPLRGPSYGGVEFEVIMLTDIRDLDQVCRGPVQGFKIWLHNPAELPNMGQNFFRLPIQYQSAAAITPRVMDTSEGLRHYLPQKRQCYFPEERYLRFFRTYTQRNCQLECSSNHTAMRCDCVPLYMPHGPETKVCGGGKKSCIIDALEELSLSKSSLQPESKGEVRDCDCLQACTELKYDAEVSQAVYDLTTYRRNPDPEIAQGRHTSPKSYELPQDRNESKLHFREAQPPRKLKKPRPFRDNVREFMAETSLHGFKYWTDDRSWIERLWWIVMTLSSIVVCAIFIRKVWNKWDETPVIVSFAETSNSVWHIPFPAITICSETKPRQRVFNFTKAHIERWSNPPKISADDLKTYHDMLLLCNNDASDGPDFAGVSSIETLQRLAPTREELFMACLWDNLTCDQMFFHTLTKDGYCFTFNMLSAEEMFRTENLHKEYYHVAGHNRSAWTLQQGYPHEATINTYPLRGPSYGGVEFEVIMLTDIRDLDQVCRGPVQGFKIWLHNPAELPNMGQNFFRLPIQYQSAAAITPRVMDTSEGLRHYLPQKRQCYFPEERYLRFFRTYTQRNCQLECSSNHTAMRCDCVPLYMPHGPETKVCGGGKKSCIIDALEELSLSKSSLQPESKGEVRDCDCLQACTELKYDAEVSQAVYDLTTYRRNPDPEIAQGRRLPSGLVVYFAEELFTSLRRSELYGGVDFLANCGGIMGLFMGFSFLSLIEIIYYFTIRLWCRIRKSSTIAAE